MTSSLYGRPDDLESRTPSPDVPLPFSITTDVEWPSTVLQPQVIATRKGKEQMLLLEFGKNKDLVLVFLPLVFVLQ